MSEFKAGERLLSYRCADKRCPAVMHLDFNAHPSEHVRHIRVAGWTLKPDGQDPDDLLLCPKHSLEPIAQVSLL